MWGEGGVLKSRGEMGWTSRVHVQCTPGAKLLAIQALYSIQEPRATSTGIVVLFYYNNEDR